MAEHEKYVASASAPVRTVLVDDCAEVRFLVAAFLESDRRFDVVGEASCATSGLRVVAATAPDLVVTDLRMGGRDGIWLLHRLRRLQPDLCLVALSAYLDERTRVEGDAAGADRMVDKDDLSQRLCDDLAELVSTTRTGRVLAPSA